jgi:Sec-independent protein translocase protein TatA
MGSSAGRVFREFKRALGELGEEAPKIETRPAGEDHPHAGESRPVS